MVLSRVENFFYIFIDEYLHNQKSIDCHIFCRMNPLLVRWKEKEVQERTWLNDELFIKERNSRVEFISKSGFGKYCTSM